MKKVKSPGFFRSIDLPPAPPPDDDKIMLPMLVLIKDHTRFLEFERSAGFERDELKQVSTIDGVRGHKNTILFIKDHVGDYIEITQYCRTHNVKMVRA